MGISAQGVEMPFNLVKNKNERNMKAICLVVLGEGDILACN
ncbi:hypothetical protein ACV229_05910 [Burkholderia sp. MR1-5-21]